MSHRPLSSTLFPSVLAIAVCVAIAATPAAAVEIGNARFNVTFGAGWSKLSGTDSGAVLAVKDNGIGGTAILSAYPHEGELTASEMATYIALYGGADSVTTVDQGTKSLGGKPFSFIELKKENPADETEAAARYKFYFANEGGYLFQAFTYYNTETGGGAITDLEAALATLEITATTGLSRGGIRMRPGFRPADHDALGRFHRAESRKAPRFRVPAP